MVGMGASGAGTRQYGGTVNAAVLAVGSELLGSDRLDTNSLRLSAVFSDHAVSVTHKAVVGDDLDLLVDQLDFLLARHGIVVITGGLGPTADDLTKEAVAALLGIDTVVDDGILESLRQRFAKRGMLMPETNIKQAHVFPDQETIRNPRGSAPGFHLTLQRPQGERHLWLFPGVPHEMEGMISDALEPWLRSLGRPTRHRRIFHFAGLSESHVEQELAPFYARNPGMPVTILAGRGEIQIRLFAEGSRATDILDGFETELRDIFGLSLWGIDSDSMESVVGTLLADRGDRVAVGESCTGGAVGARITNVPGSSGWFAGGVIAYTREIKMMMLGVDPALIDLHGEVSEAVARDLAEGARRRFDAEWGIGVTGIAGPGGGSEEKPVGSVHVAVARRGSQVHRQLNLPGDRKLVRQLTTLQALDLLRRQLIAQDPPSKE